MIILILETLFLIVGLIAVVIGLKGPDALILGMGNFLLFGVLFFEVMIVRDKIKESSGFRE